MLTMVGNGCILETEVKIVTSHHKKGAALMEPTKLPRNTVVYRRGESGTVLSTRPTGAFVLARGTRDIYDWQGRCVQRNASYTRREYWKFADISLTD